MEYIIDDLDKLNIDSKLEKALNNTQSNLLQSTDWQIITKELLWLCSKVISNSDNIEKCYSLYGDNNTYDKDKILNLLNMYNIQKEDSYNIDEYRLLVKCIPRILQLRGTKAGITYLLHILRRSEKELYEDDKDNTYIYITNYSNYNIIYDERINGKEEFIQDLLYRVYTAGIGFKTIQDNYNTGYNSANSWFIGQEPDSEEGKPHGNIVIGKLKSFIHIDSKDKQSVYNIWCKSKLHLTYDKGNHILDSGKALNTTKTLKTDKMLWFEDIEYDY